MPNMAEAEEVTANFLSRNLWIINLGSERWVTWHPDVLSLHSPPIYTREHRRSPSSPSSQERERSARGQHSVPVKSSELGKGLTFEHLILQGKAVWRLIWDFTDCPACCFEWRLSGACRVGAKYSNLDHGNSSVGIFCSVAQPGSEVIE